MLWSDHGLWVKVKIERVRNNFNFKNNGEKNDLKKKTNPNSAFNTQK